MNRKQRNQKFREQATDLERVDLEVYQQFGKDPLEPIIGEGHPRARVTLFGRDPGREEVRRSMPFIGAGGQKVRGVVHRVIHNREMTTFQESVEAGSYLFWANTVPYKPVGNKAWSQSVKKRFKPLMADLLLNEWQGKDIITLGREAFLWFGIGCDRSTRLNLEAFWRSENRFTQSLAWTLESGDGKRELTLHPLPHPSPLNATWYSRFPTLLEHRLRTLGLSKTSWQTIH